MSETRLEVEVEVRPTEDPEKVTTAVNRVLGDLKLESKKREERDFLVGKSEGAEALGKFHDLLRRERILDAARSVMLKGLRGETITFYLNKQAAFAGHISFSQPEGESPLGPIKFEILCDDPMELIDWLTPRTMRR